MVSEGVSNGVERAMGRILRRVVRTEDVLVLNGWNEPPWGSIDVVSANELALVPIGSDYASHFEERIDYHLGGEGEMKGETQVVLRSSVEAWVCQRKVLKWKFCTS